MKVTFELNIQNEEIYDLDVIDATSPIFTDATGKVFLARDTLTQAYTLIHCLHGIEGDRKYAAYNMFPLPVNASIVDEKPRKDTIAMIYTAVLDLQTSHEKLISDIEGTLNTLEGMEANGGNGVSEKTLLEALRITSHLKTEE